MTPGIAIALLPFLILFGAPILLLLLIALKRSYSAVGGVSLLILVGAFVSIFPASRAAPFSSDSWLPRGSSSDS
jgi:hypothetical protein